MVFDCKYLAITCIHKTLKKHALACITLTALAIARVTNRSIFDASTVHS